MPSPERSMDGRIAGWCLGMWRMPEGVPGSQAAASSSNDRRPSDLPDSDIARLHQACIPDVRPHRTCAVHLARLHSVRLHYMAASVVHAAEGCCLLAQFIRNSCPACVPTTRVALHQTGWQADLDVGVSTVMLRTSSSASLSRPCLTGLVTTTYLHTLTSDAPGSLKASAMIASRQCSDVKHDRGAQG